MLKIRMPKALREADGYLFDGYSRYSKKKLYCLSETYEELARLYRGIPGEDDGCTDRRDVLYRRQLQQTKEVFASHLDEISDAFADVADTVVRITTPLEHKRKSLIQYLRKRGIAVREIVFIEGGEAGSLESTADGHCGNRIGIEARTIGRHDISAGVLGGLLSSFYGRKLILSSDGAQTIGRGYDTFIFEDEPRYLLLSAISRAVREGEKVSGDNFSMEEYNQGQVILMIADGMGSGEQACRDSQSVIEFMERFLEAGFRKEKAITMVNGAIAAQNRCCSLTALDICSVNLLTGDAEFIKAGAAASYIRRAGGVDEVASDTLPLGSMEELGQVTQTVRLSDADMLIMVSDGITDAVEGESAGKMREIIGKSGILNPKEMSEHILRCAINAQGGRIRDDMTVLACVIKKRP